MKITSIMATGLAMHQCAPINQPGSATECTRTHDALKQFPSKCGVRMQLEKKLQHTRSKSRPSAAPASISNIVGTAVGSAVTYYSTAPFGLHAALNNRRTIKNTATEFLFVGAVGATAGTIFTDKNTFVTQSLRGYLAGSGAIIGCAIGENIHKTLGLNTNVGCLAGSASSSYILDMQAPNFAWDFFKLGLINLALSGTEYYCLSLKKNALK